MSLLSVVIPSRTEKYLQKTVDDVLAKAVGPVEVIVVLDGYWPKEYDWSRPEIHVIHHGKTGRSRGMRASINLGMEAALGEFVLKCDEHVLFAPGFDKQLKADYQPNQLVVPRRYRLDADAWKVIEDGRPPIDYMFIEDRDGYLHGTEWKRAGREAFTIDSTMSWQGSAWFTSKDYWKALGPLDDRNYGTFAQEAQELGFRALLGGGDLVVNKATWYAHWHRKDSGYGFTPEENAEYRAGIAKGRAFAHDYWTNNRWPGAVHPYSWLWEKFPDAPKGV